MKVRIPVVCPPPLARGRPAAARSGFTLIELMVVAALAALLAALAYPSFLSQLRQSRRADAVLAITAVQQAQERWRANHASYAASLTGAWPVEGLGQPGTTRQGYYTISLATLPETRRSAYTVIAIAVPGTSQASDTGCTRLTLTVSDGASVATPSDCWSR